MFYGLHCALHHIGISRLRRATRQCHFCFFVHKTPLPNPPRYAKYFIKVLQGPPDRAAKTASSRPFGHLGVSRNTRIGKANPQTFNRNRNLLQWGYHLPHRKYFWRSEGIDYVEISVSPFDAMALLSLQSRYFATLVASRQLVVGY
jgi:hypothetical protein